jgi:hypothetical protein
MIIKPPPLSIKRVSVFAALFKAQLPDTLSAIRQALPDWVAVHVMLEQAGTLRKTITPEQMKDEILANLGDEAMALDPIYRLTTPEIPPGTIGTFVPNQLRPKLAPQYQDFTYIMYPQARAHLKKICEQAIGGEPAGLTGIASAFTGKINGSAVMEGWGGSIGLPTLRRTLEGMVEPGGKVMFWDTAFGFETTGSTFVKIIDRVLNMADSKDDRLYFDCDTYSWFVAFHPGGQMRVGLLG